MPKIVVETDTDALHIAARIACFGQHKSQLGAFDSKSKVSVYDVCAFIAKLRIHSRRQIYGDGVVRQRVDIVNYLQNLASRLHYEPRAEDSIYHYLVGAIYAIWVVRNGHTVGQSAHIDGTVIIETVGEKQRHTAHKTFVA